MFSTWKKKVGWGFKRKWNNLFFHSSLVHFRHFKPSILQKAKDEENEFQEKWTDRVNVVNDGLLYWNGLQVPSFSSYFHMVFLFLFHSGLTRSSLFYFLHSKLSSRRLDSNLRMKRKEDHSRGHPNINFIHAMPLNPFLFIMSSSCPDFIWVVSWKREIPGESPLLYISCINLITTWGRNLYFMLQGIGFIQTGCQPIQSISTTDEKTRLQ